ncbi:MAG: PSD1 domain-containing protein, partial [Planctomycetaceae bacterium]|nr:PSD1 domain-containing protein [Planctomycetaceae bacterium]
MARASCLMCTWWLCVSLASTALADEKQAAAKLEFFEKRIRPLLVVQCYACHSAATKPSGELRVDDRNGLLAGGKTGAAIVPGEPDKSLLIERLIATDAKRRMPRESDALSPAQIADLRRWIKEGAVWPTEQIADSIARANPEYDRLKATHWSWQPIRQRTVPKVVRADWPTNELDHFVLAKLEAEQLAPVGDAARGNWIRRVNFDLTGLPPSPADVNAFVTDDQPRAEERLVDRLLSSAAFGERWGRHWLDVARYGESTGPSRNIPYPFAWRYRNYVIDAINGDMPFDRFLQEQIAGDLLPFQSAGQRNRQLTATGFLALGVKDVNQRFKVRFVMDNVDEQIDVVCRSVLALTVSCARCHDHKFDPIPTADYYALAGIFTSTDNCAGVRNKMGGNGLDYYDTAMLLKIDAPVVTAAPEQVALLTRAVAEAKEAWDNSRNTGEGSNAGTDNPQVQREFRAKYEKLRDQLSALSDPTALGLSVHGVREAQKIADTQIRIRGEAERLGPEVPRGFLSLVALSDTPSISAEQSGRLELATWLTRRDHPLTSRVIVNRVWAHLFGRGIVSTVDNFGVTGDQPTHPELLDYLADRFTAQGWSLKRLVREIVLSRTYRLSAAASETALAKDPANHWLWRHTPRRLSAEEFRDAILASSQTLDRGRPVESPVRALRMVEIRDDGPEA